MANINVSSNSNFYQELEQVIPAGKIVIIEQPFRSFRILYVSSTPENLEYKLGRNGFFTPFTPGLGPIANDTLDSISIHNKSSVDITLRFALSYGVIMDDRLSVSGAVQVSEVPYENINYQHLTFSESGEIELDTTGAKKVLIVNNSGSASVFLFAADGIEIDPKGSFEFNFSGQFAAYGTEGGTIKVLILS